MGNRRNSLVSRLKAYRASLTQGIEKDKVREARNAGQWVSPVPTKPAASSSENKRYSITAMMERLRGDLEGGNQVSMARRISQTLIGSVVPQSKLKTKTKQRTQVAPNMEMGRQND